jgi:hypothetical protein
MPQISSPNSHSASPSPISFPPSPLVCGEIQQQCSAPFAYLNLNTPSSLTSSPASLPINVSYPTSLLDTSALLDDLALRGQRYTLTAQPFDHSAVHNHPSSRSMLPRIAGVNGTTATTTQGYRAQGQNQGTYSECAQIVRRLCNCV